MAKARGVAETQGGGDVVDLEERGRQVVDSQGLAQARQQFQIGRPLFVEPSPQRPGVDAQPRRDLVDAGKAAGVRVSSAYTRRLMPELHLWSSNSLAQAAETWVAAIGFANWGVRSSHSAG